MKTSVVLLLVSLFSAPAFAYSSNQNYQLTNGFDFVAPSVHGTGSVADLQVGMIVYDTSANAFKGLDSSGAWDTMAVSGSNVVTSAASSDRVERVSVTSTCSSSPCTIASQSGSWVTSITRSSAGNYTLNIAAGVFSGTPACTINGIGAGAIAFGTGAPTTTSWTFIIDNTGGANIDGQFNIICMGPR